MAEQVSDFELKWELLVADAWADDALMKRLKTDPAAVMKERGLAVPAGVTIKVSENSDKVWNMVIPVKPTSGELSEEQLEAVAGGHGCVSVTIGACRTCAGCAVSCRSCGGCGHCHTHGCHGCGGCGGCGGCRGCGS